MRATPRPCNTGGWQNAGEGQGDEGKRERRGRVGKREISGTEEGKKEPQGIMGKDSN